MIKARIAKLAVAALSVLALAPATASAEYVLICPSGYTSIPVSYAAVDPALDWNQNGLVCAQYQKGRIRRYSDDYALWVP